MLPAASIWREARQNQLLRIPCIAVTLILWNATVRCALTNGFTARGRLTRTNRQIECAVGISEWSGRYSQRLPGLAELTLRFLSKQT